MSDGAPAGGAEPPRARTTIRPTAFGLVVLVLLVAAIVARPPVADPSVVGLVWAGLLGAVVFGVAWPILTVHTVGVRVVGGPTDLVVGQLSTLDVELTGRASGLSAACTGQEMTVLDVVAPGTVRVPISVARRGAYRRVQLDIGSDAPFGIVSATRSRLVDLPRLLLVGPDTVAESVPSGDAVGDHELTRPAAAAPRGEAVRSVRPYTTGDPSHLVHWPSTARTGSLVVRELEPPAAEAVAIVVDLRSPDDAHREHAASRAAGAVAAALAGGARVLLCTAEPAGPVAGDVTDPLTAQRRLALAVDGPPAEPPDGWTVHRVTAVAPPGRPAGAPVPAGSAVSTAPRRVRGKVSPDRRTISNLRVWALTALVAAQLWAALSALPTDRGRNLAAEAAALCAVLAIFGLRSVPIRWIVRGLTVVSGSMLGRFGELGAYEGVGGSWEVLVWLGVTAAALALAPSSRAVPGAHGVAVSSADLPTPATSGGAFRRGSSAGRVAPGRRDDRGRVPVALLVAAVALVGASSLLVGPRVATGFPSGSRAGDIADFGENRSGNVLAASDRLDMTGRPRLSDRVVMTVRSPITSFWRTEVFDVWDGSTWTRSRGNAGALLGDPGRVTPDAHDVAATDGVPSTQEFRLEAGFATAVPSAASPVLVEGPGQLAQRVDGTLVSPVDPLGRGSTYTVRSAQVPVDAAMLRESSDRPIPREIRARYAEPPVATARVVDLARRVTAGATNDYDRIRAIEAWMDANTEYSLDAPLSPRGVDVVDHFLFTERLGWCEQIASSLVVMARSVGVPARLATGFAPGEWDQVGRRFVVREREAHAWAEVWFPGAGWVPFDPTAGVPLAGTDEATAGAAARDWRELGGLALLVVAAGVLVAGSARRALRRWSGTRRSRRRRARQLRECWDVAEEVRIERLGAAAGRPREPGETLTAYSAQVAAVVGDPALSGAGAAVDEYRYAPCVTTLARSVPSRE